MSDDDRIARLEQRLQVLEGLVRELMTARAASPTRAAHTPPPLLPAPPAPPVPRPVRATGTGASVTAPVFSEQWLGQRGLLAVGVTFVILAAGYLLKLSVDRGWISPLTRCVAGALAGGGIGYLGWRLHGRGTRTYGAALIGCGAAVMYLAVWAATRLYQFIPPAPAIVALALVSLGLAAIALAIDVEALGATAALGAFLAPIVIGREGGDVNLLLLYLGAMGATLGWVAVRRRWRLATLVVALAYFGIAGSGILSSANSTLLYLHAILGGAAGLYAGLREGWFETRLLAFSGGWGVLGVANRVSPSHWPTLLGGMALTVPVWWRALRVRTVWPDGKALGDTFYFYLSPLFLGVALRTVARELFERHPGLLPALVAVPCLALGLTAVRRPFALVAALALGAAALAEWSGLGAVRALLLSAALWAGMDHLLARDDGRWYALLALGVGIGHLVLTDLPVRSAAEPAFTGPWAVTLWAALALTALLAARLMRDDTWELAPGGLRPPLWILAGGLLFFGVTGELRRYFEQAAGDAETGGLAGGLSVSAWWICFAAGCFFAGFRRRVRPLRLAGFAVAGLALLKVVFVDLSQLDALYRVGSAFLLGVVSLGVAYAYHRSASARVGSG